VTALRPDYDADPDRFLSSSGHPHDDVHPQVTERFRAAGARRVLDAGGGHGRLSRLLPALYLLYHFDDPLLPIAQARRTRRTCACTG
jgi:hypothetical protein